MCDRSSIAGASTQTGTNSVERQKHNFSDCVAWIPWLPRRSETVPLEESEFFRRYIGQKSKEPCGRLASHRYAILEIFNDSFPFYLPSSYHSMEIAQNKQTIKILDYWLSATHFVRTCSDLSTLPFFDINNDLLARKGFIKKRKITRRLSTQNLKGPRKVFLESSKSAAEFLFEPWVLLQLPFQPALLHQWAVAAYAESLIFSKRLVEIGTRGHAPNFQGLFNKLAELGDTLSRNCNELLATFFLVYCDKPEEHVHAKSRRVYAKLEEQVAETLAVLQFVMDDGCTKILNFIKKNSWSKTVPLDQLVLPDLKFVQHERNLKNITPYNECFWLAHFKITALCIQRGKVDRHYNLKSDEELSAYKEYKSKHNVKKIEALTKKLVQDSFMNDRLRGLHKKKEFLDKLAAQLSQQDNYLLQYNMVLYLKERDYLNAAEPAHQKGILYDILTLRANLNAELYLGTIERLIWNAAKKFDDSFYPDASDLQKPLQFSVQTCLDQIENLKISKVHWSMDSILASVKENCSRPLSIKPTNNFKGRIQKIVLAMYEKYHEALCDERDRPFHFNPECLLVQYILPCYVSIHKAVENDSCFDLDAIEEYSRFVNLLIRSYEEEEFVQVLGKFKKQNFACPKNDFYDKAKDYVFCDVVALGIFPVTPRNNFMILVKLFLDVIFCNNTANLAEIIPNKRSQYPCEATIQFGKLLLRITKGFSTNRWFTENSLVSLDLTSFQIFSLFKETASDVDKVIELRMCVTSLLKPLSVQCKQKIRKDKLQDLELLTLHQLLSISLYEAWSENISSDAFFSRIQGPLFPLDPLTPLATMVLSRDSRSIANLFAQASKIEGSPGLIPLAVAKKNLSYRAVLNSLSRAGKVKMDHPGQITFFPIQHCRWCGLVYANEFRLCAECMDEPGYLDLHYFCSVQCEMEALKKYHVEEHASFVMEKLGL